MEAEAEPAEGINATTDGKAHRLLGLGAPWLSAIAALVSALVAAVALIVNAADNTHDSSTLQAASIASPVAPDASPKAGAQRSVSIETMSFVGPDKNGPAFEFYGTAELLRGDAEEIRVIARPVEDDSFVETWLTSPPATLDDAGRWSARIPKPPLPEGSFDFAAVITPTKAAAPVMRPNAVPLWQASQGATRKVCGLKASLRDAGVDSCLVLDATETARFDG